MNQDIERLRIKELNRPERNSLPLDHHLEDHELY